MRALIILLILILAGITVGYFIHQGPGYILIAYHHTTIETSLWVGALILIIAYFILNLIFWLIRQIASIGWRVSAWSTQRRARKIHDFTYKGLCELAEGGWQKSETNLIYATKHNHKPLINYLAAAYAANTQKAFDRRDKYLRLADKSCPDDKIPVAITQATLQIRSEQWEQALATLKSAHEQIPSHPYVLSLLKQVYITLNDWSLLNEIIPKLRKLRVESDTALDQLQCQVYEHLLCDTDYWDTIPRKWRQEPDLLRLQTAKLIECGRNDDAAALVEQAIKNQWDDILIHHYGRIQSSNPNQQLSHAEKWLKKHPHDFGLLLCLGRLSLLTQFYGKAKQYLEEALQIQSSKEATQVLAQVFLALDDKEAALNCFLS